MDNEVRLHHGQRYVCVGQESYTRKRDGLKTSFLVWETACAECDRPFRVRTAQAATAFAPSRRCHRHRRPGQRATVIDPPLSQVETEKTSTPTASQRTEAMPDAPPSNLPAFSIGDHVKHTKFGSGVVVAVEGERVDVQFEYQGIKPVLASFLDLTPRHGQQSGGDLWPGR